MDRPEVREEEVLLRPSQVAALFDVDPKTVSSWADSGKLSVIWTLGGHRRYLQTEVLALRRETARLPSPRKRSD
jgi:predicted site-specific integrase-resolvase